METYSVDPKKSSFEFMAANGSMGTHHFRVLQDILDENPKARPYCLLHKSSVCHALLKSGDTEDTLVIAGFPCSPFSLQRSSSERWPFIARDLIRGQCSAYNCIRFMSVSRQTLTSKTQGRSQLQVPRL